MPTIVSQVSWLSIIAVLMSIAAFVGIIYVSVLTFNNRSSIEFLKKVFTNDSNQITNLTERLRTAEVSLDKYAASRNKEVYTLHSSAQIAVALNISKTQTLCLIEEDIIPADRIGSEWKMTDDQFYNAKLLVDDKAEKIKLVKDLQEFKSLFCTREEQQRKQV